MKKLMIITLLMSTLGLTAAEEPVKKDTADRIKYLEIGDKAKSPTKRRKLKEDTFKFFENMPLDATKHVIIPKLSIKDLVSFGKTSKKHNQIIQDELEKRIPEFSDLQLVKFSKLSDEYLKLAKGEITKRTQAQNKRFKELAGNSTTLNLSNKKITYIFPGAFEGLNNLVVLNLDYNKLTKIEPGAFKGLNNLKRLDLDINKLTTIKPRAFEGLNKLKRLYLRDNKLTTIEPGAFEGLNNLKRLYLDYNKLTEENKEQLRRQALPGVIIEF